MSKWDVFRRFEMPEGDALTNAQELADRDGRGSITEAMLILKAETGEFLNIEQAVKNGEIPSYAPGSCKPLQGNESAMSADEEVYADDLNAWLDRHYPRIMFRFQKVGGGGTAKSEESTVEVGADRTTDQPEQEASEPRMRVGSNPAQAYKAWIDWQARNLLKPNDTYATLAERIEKVAEGRNYRNQAGDPLSIDVIKKAIPAITGGRAKNGRKSAKVIRTSKSN